MEMKFRFYKKNGALIFPSVRLLPSWPHMLFGVLILLFIYAGVGMTVGGHLSKKYEEFYIL